VRPYGYGQRCNVSFGNEPKVSPRNIQVEHAAHRNSWLKVAGMIALTDPKVSTTPWSNRFIFSLVSSESHPVKSDIRGEGGGKWITLHMTTFMAVVETGRIRLGGSPSLQRGWKSC
jgi:hypothetical protein